MANRNLMPDVVRSERGALSPFRELNRLQRRMDRFFDTFFSEPFPALLRPTREILEEEEFIPACDIDETDTHYVVNFDLPGLKKDEINIEVRDNQLIVSGERKRERKEEARGRWGQERYYGSFTRSFTLPSSVDPNKVEANYENGVLQIALPKTEVTKGKQIPIKEGKLITREKEKEIKPEKAA